MSQSYRGKFWCFTINNYTNDDEQRVAGLCPGPCDYVICGREIGESGTPHLQGYAVWHQRVRFHTVRSALGDGRAHIERARGSPSQNIKYCSKDGDFSVWGIPPTENRNDTWEVLKTAVREENRMLTEREIIENHLPIYRQASFDYAVIQKIMAAWLEIGDLPVPRGEPRPWQQALIDAVTDPCDDDRSVLFYVDPEGGEGKSWVSRYLAATLPERVQILGVGKRDDMAYMIDPSKDIFIIDCPRSQSEHLQYSILEMLKNQYVVSNKYKSRCKVILKQPHVIVFMNEDPNREKLSEDRYIVMQLPIENANEPAAVPGSQDAPIVIN